ncbi:MAG: nucleotidyltransferase family protein [Bacteroidales bacterium]|nr:nucleotidyltransferase family protein [Bacteroidales bacterium]
MINEAIILAGGFGTRLRGVVNDVPKSMAPVKGKPFLFWLFKYLEKQNIGKVIIASGYRHESIESYFGTALGSIGIEYSVEKEPLDTGGAVLLASSLVKGEAFFVLNGDTFYDVNLLEFEKFFIESEAVMSVALKPMSNSSRYGSVVLKNNRITAFREKGINESGLINGGVYIVNKKWFIKAAPGLKFSMEKNILEKRIESDIITGFISDAAFIDIGVPEDYMRAEEEMPEWLIG